MRAKPLRRAQATYGEAHPFVRVQGLCALTLHALLARPHISGRDWFDFTWYVSGRVAPHLLHLEAAKRSVSFFGNKDVAECQPPDGSVEQGVPNTRLDVLPDATHMLLINGTEQRRRIALRGRGGASPRYPDDHRTKWEIQRQ